MKSSDTPFRPMVVAAISDPASLKFACSRAVEAVDWLEIRVDHWATDPSALISAIPKLKKPLLLTVRHPKEGGANNLSLKKRFSLFEEFLPCARMIDIEERSLVELRPIFIAAKTRRIPVIVSFHDFKGTPALDVLLAKLENARKARADIFKVAVTPRNATELARLLELLDQKPHFPIAAMGMGPLGKLSRLACASLGSILNYCYLGTPNAGGQWPAKGFADRVSELLPTQS